MSLFCPQPFAIRRPLEWRRKPCQSRCHSSPSAPRRRSGEPQGPGSPRLSRPRTSSLGGSSDRHPFPPSSQSPTSASRSGAPGSRRQDVTGTPHSGCRARWVEAGGPRGRALTSAWRLGSAAAITLWARRERRERRGPRTPRSWSQPWQGSPGRRC